METVLITWVDAVTSSEPGWTTKEEALVTASSPLPLMHTVGFVLYKDSEHIALTDSRGDDEFGQVTKIPIAMIVQCNRMECIDKENNQWHK